MVDDSALIRELFTTILNSDPEIEVVGTAVDPYDAREKIKALNPDVVTLDIEMPKMDGISFLKKIMSLRPMAVVMVSSLTQKGAKATLDALEIGAVDYVPKSDSQSFDSDRLKDDLISKVKAASKAKVKVYDENKPAPAKISFSGTSSNKIIAIGSSTGGVEALKEVITILPENIPPVLMVQHMPEKFTATFAGRLNNDSTISICEAEDGMEIKSGHGYIAPGSYHMEISARGGKKYISLNRGELVSGHRPSVDVLFRSVARHYGGDAVGVILTGMGKDGAKGLLEMKMQGAKTIGQDEATSIVYGMPKAAYLAGAVDIQKPLEKIAQEILRKCV